MSTPTISIRSCHVLAFRPPGPLVAQFEAFCNVALSLNIPVHTCNSDQIDYDILDALVKKIGAPRIESDEIILLICGSYLEEQISLAAQYFLIVGYKVLLLRDIILARNPEHSQFHDLRLNQCGALLTTQQQVGYEWLATEKSDTTRKALKMILAA